MGAQSMGLGAVVHAVERVTAERTRPGSSADDGVRSFLRGYDEAGRGVRDGEG